MDGHLGHFSALQRATEIQNTPLLLLASSLELAEVEEVKGFAVQPRYRNGRLLKRRP